MKIRMIRSIGKADQLLKSVPEGAAAELLSAVEGKTVEIIDQFAELLIERGLAERQVAAKPTAPKDAVNKSDK